MSLNEMSLNLSLNKIIICPYVFGLHLRETEFVQFLSELPVRIAFLKVYFLGYIKFYIVDILFNR